MDYPKHLFRHPGPYGSGVRSYDVAGATDEDQEIALLDRGWHASKEAAWRVAVLDHDGDGKSGGSLKHAGTEMPKLRAEYTELAGKKPFAGWDESTLREKMAALKEAK